MKKIITVFLMIVLLLSLSACNGKRLPVEQSEQNFIKYEEDIKAIAEKYGYNVENAPEKDYGFIYIDPPEEKNPPQEESNSYGRHLLIAISDSEQIEIVLANCEEHEKIKYGTEQFSIYYTQNANNKQFNLKLFVELANTFSGKEVTVETFEDFLNGDKYLRDIPEFSSTKMGKYRALNFWEDWVLYYDLYNKTVDSPEKEELSFSGLTKSGTQHYNLKELFAIWIIIVILLSVLAVIITIIDNRKKRRLKHKTHALLKTENMKTYKDIYLFY